MAAEYEFIHDPNIVVEEPVEDEEQHIDYLLEDEAQMMASHNAPHYGEAEEFVCIEETECVGVLDDDNVEYLLEVDEEMTEHNNAADEEEHLAEQGIVTGEQQWEMLDESDVNRQHEADENTLTLEEEEEEELHGKEQEEQIEEADDIDELTEQTTSNDLAEIKQEFISEACDEVVYLDGAQYVIKETAAEEVVYNEQYLEQQHENVLEMDEAQLEKVFIKKELEIPPLDDSDDNANKFCCYECNCLFADLESAKQHNCAGVLAEAEEIEQQTTTLWPCAHCRSAFSDAESFERHQRTCRLKSVAAAKEFKCQHCDKRFNSQKTLSSHMRVHKDKLQADNKQKVKCQICETEFGSEKNLKLHMKIHNKRPSKSIQEALPAGAHSQYNELNQFYCEICNKSFDQNLLAVHKNMHQNIEEYVCGVCNRQFENLPSYEMHLQLHEDKNENRRVGNANNNNNTNVPPSSFNADPSAKRRFPCKFCGREFGRPYEKVKHERVHTGEKPYECEVCGKTFRVSYSLTLHLRTHTDIRPYVCATCNKRFKSQPVYKHHLGTHLVDRPHKCDMCSKTFRTSVQLCGHKNSHRKPFNCTECNRPFATLYAVKIHMKTHNKANKSNENLKHRCGICGAEYARIFALRYHMKGMHSIEFDAKSMTQTNGGAGGVSDDDAALLIAAAAEADAARGEDDEDDDEDDEEFQDEDELEDETHAATRQITQDAEGVCYSSDGHDISSQAILQNEEIIVDSFHTEEIVADWLAN